MTFGGMARDGVRDRRGPADESAGTRLPLARSPGTKHAHTDRLSRRTTAELWSASWHHRTVERVVGRASEMPVRVENIVYEDKIRVIEASPPTSPRPPPFLPQAEPLGGAARSSCGESRPSLQ